MVFLDFDQKKNVLNSILHENEKKNLKVIFSQYFIWNILQSQFCK